MSDEISENVFWKSKYKFGTYEEAKAYREAVVADLKENRKRIRANHASIIFLLVVVLVLVINNIMQ